LKEVSLVLALIGAVAADKPCLNLAEDDCKSMGCQWTNRCSQPSECSSSGNIRYKGVGNTGVRATRKPISPEVAQLCDEHPECSAMYVVELDQKFTTGPPNCNDLGMLPPHGRDQRECADTNPELFKSKNGLYNLVNHPFPNDAVKQNVAKGANAVTALMEETRECWSSDECAFPLGFATDTLLKGKSVCIEVKNAKDKWVEIMASSRQGSDGGSFCSKDWGGEGADEACTKEGDLYECRESGNRVLGKGAFSDSMKIRFVAQDNTDDANMEIYWRIVASKLPEGKTGVANEEKDAEDWCQFRDSSDYPMSLMGAYPTGYDGKPVFEVEESAASHATAAALATVSALAAALFF